MAKSHHIWVCIINKTFIRILIVKLLRLVQLSTITSDQWAVTTHAPKCLGFFPSKIVLDESCGWSKLTTKTTEIHICSCDFQLSTEYLYA